MYQAIQRYGPSGTFWSDHQGFDTALLAVKDWEVWNEPHLLRVGWMTPDSGFGYPVPHTLPETLALQESLYRLLCDVAIRAAELTGKTARMMVGSFGPPLDEDPDNLGVMGVEWLERYTTIVTRPGPGA